MVYISHKRKFIFLKTRKTAGTTTQFLLMRNYIEGDIFSKLIPEESPLIKKLNKHSSFTNPHPTSYEIRRRLGNKYDDYFTFTFVRNPYTMLVSFFTWKCRNNEKKWNRKNFEKWLLNNRYKPQMHNTTIYMRGNKIDVDFVGKFENYEEDLKTVFKKLNLPINNIPVLKKLNRQPIRKFYNTKIKNIVKKYWKDEIEMFDYKFPQIQK